MKNIIFIAPPASGKGTQSELLEDKYDYIHISTGDILREEVKNKTEFSETVKNIMQNGKLVSDELITKILSKRLDSLTDKLFVLDGFPRTMNQAKMLDDIFNKQNTSYVVIYLEIDKTLAMHRALGRLVCSCGRSYNLYDEKLKPKHDNKCDECGRTLHRRSDDTEEHFEERFNSYLESTMPVIEHYDKCGKLYKVDASINPMVTFKQIEDIING